MFVLLILQLVEYRQLARLLVCYLIGVLALETITIIIIVLLLSILSRYIRSISALYFIILAYACIQ